MCGVLFSYNPALSSFQHINKTRKAIKKLQHRGPDEHNLWSEDDCLLAHTRLSIVDISASHQPFESPCGRYILSFNGEIYNYKKLRIQLTSKWNFRTQGDTEVLLAGIILEGERFIQKLEGMWAFSLWDKIERSLLLCRDRLGKKPLYYNQNKDSLTVSSELPALLSLSDTAIEEDLDSTADYLRYGFYLPGHTIYQNIKEVMPAHFVRWKPGQTVQQNNYWQLNTSPTSLSKIQAIDQIQYLIEEAVKKRLIADVEIGAFLSGGIDSSMIVAIIRERLGVPLKTFTLGFTEKSFDESSYAREVSQHYKTNHFEEILKEWDPNHLNTLISDHVGQPFADPSILPTSMVSQLASKHVKVALSGDGGDELFSGYQRYQARTILRWYTRLPQPFKKSIEHLINALPEPTSHHSRSILKKAHLFSATIGRLESETPYIAPMFYSNQQLAELCPDIAHRGHQTVNESEAMKLDDIQEMMYRDALIYLPQDILLKVDRASMAHSLETRAPFLDHKVVEMAFSIPVNWHRSPFSGKKILHESFGKLLPDNIWKRRKQGFGVPLSDWFKGFLGHELAALNDKHDTPLNKNVVSNLLNTHRQGNKDLNLRLWQLYCYLKWKDLTHN